MFSLKGCCCMLLKLLNLVEGILHKYSKLESKGQKASVKKLKKAFTPNCPAYKFKILRGDLTKEQVYSLLKKVHDKEFSLEVERYFMVETGCKTWDEAKDRYAGICINEV